jgi:hypothetical protein
MKMVVIRPTYCKKNSIAMRLMAIGQFFSSVRRDSRRRLKSIDGGHKVDGFKEVTEQSQP